MKLVNYLFVILSIFVHDNFGDVIVELGTNVSLECGHGYGDSPNQINWYLETEDIAEVRDTGVTWFGRQCENNRCSITYPQGELLIWGVEFDNEGLYECKARPAPGPGIDFNKYDISIQVSPSTFEMSGIDEEWVVAGQSYELKCEIPRIKPEGKAIWVVDGREETTSTNCKPNNAEPTCSITVTHDLSVAKQEDDMELVCRVKFMNNTIWAEKPYKTIPVYNLPDKATITASASEPEHGQSVSFDCSATQGKPDVDEYLWHYEGSYITTTQTSNWILGPVDLETDDGEYTCAGENTAGTGPTSNPATITVYLSPSTYEISGIDEDWVLPGQSYTLTCVIPRIKPKGRVVWLVDGQEETTYNRNKPNDREPTWHQTGTSDLSVVKQDDNISLTCRVKFENGTTWAEKHYKAVQVYYPPITIVVAATADPPVEGKSYIVRCVAIGQPNIFDLYAWKRNGTIVDAASKEFLNIEQLSRTGEVYTCAAQNVAGMGPYGEPLNIDVMCPSSSSTTGLIVAVVIGWMVAIASSTALGLLLWRTRTTSESTNTAPPSKHQLNGLRQEENHHTNRSFKGDLHPLEDCFAVTTDELPSKVVHYTNTGFNQRDVDLAAYTGLAQKEREKQVYDNQPDINQLYDDLDVLPTLSTEQEEQECPYDEI